MHFKVNRRSGRSAFGSNDGEIISSFLMESRKALFGKLINLSMGGGDGDERLIHHIPHITFSSEVDTHFSNSPTSTSSSSGAGPFATLFIIGYID